MVAFHLGLCLLHCLYFSLKAGQALLVGGHQEMLISSSIFPVRSPSHPLLPRCLARQHPAAFHMSLTGFTLPRAANFLVAPSFTGSKPVSGVFISILASHGPLGSAEICDAIRKLGRDGVFDSFAFSR